MNAVAKKKPISGPKITWTPEQVKTMTDAFPALLTTQDDYRRRDLALEAQKLLPKEAQRSDAAMHWLAVRKPDSLKAMLGWPVEKARVDSRAGKPTGRTIPPEQRAKMQEAHRKFYAERAKQKEQAKLEAAKPKEEVKPALALAREIASLEQVKKQLEGQAKEASKEEAKETHVRWTLPLFAHLAHDPKVKALIDKPHNPAPLLLTEAVMKAQQKHFPRHLWRPRASVQQSCYGKPGLVNQLRMGLAMPNPHAVEPVEAPQSVAQEEVAPMAAPAPKNAVVNPVADALATLAAVALPALSRLLEQVVRGVVHDVVRETFAQATPKPADAPSTKQITDAVRQTVIDILGAPAPQPEAPSTPKAQEVSQPAKKVAKTRVDIVGLLGDQEQVVKAKYGHLFDLRFVATQDAERQKVTAPTVIMLTKFVKHSTQDRIKKSGANLLYANGGAESVGAHLAAMH